MTKTMTYEEVRDTVASWSIEGKRLPIVEFIDSQQRAIEQAQRLIRTARMCMNPKTNANWFDEATALLAGSAVEPTVPRGEDIVDLLEARGDELSKRAARHIRLKRQSADAWREQALKAGRLSLESESESVNRYRCMACNAPYSTIQMLDAHEEHCNGQRTTVPQTGE